MIAAPPRVVGGGFLKLNFRNRPFGTLQFPNNPDSDTNLFPNKGKSKAKVRGFFYIPNYPGSHANLFPNRGMSKTHLSVSET